MATVHPFGIVLNCAEEGVAQNFTLDVIASHFLTNYISCDDILVTHIDAYSSGSAILRGSTFKAELHFKGQFGSAINTFFHLWNGKSAFSAEFHSHFKFGTTFRTFRHKTSPFLFPPEKQKSIHPCTSKS